MRKLLCLVVVAALGLSACQTKTADNATTTDQTAQPSAEQTATAPEQTTPAAPAQDQAAVDKAIIEKYVADNGLKGKYTDSGIFYAYDKEGKGAQPTIADAVEVHYKGSLLDGTKFDSSYDRGQPAQFPLTRVVRGWQEGIPLFKEGGKGTLLIPSSLAYGAMGMPPAIPPNAVLRFDIELLKVMKMPAQH